jgi:hypothetical protein
MMMEKLILSLNIRENNIMRQVQNLAEKEDYINNNIMTIKNEDFVHYMILG